MGKKKANEHCTIQTTVQCYCTTTLLVMALKGCHFVKCTRHRGVTYRAADDSLDSAVQPLETGTQISF